MGFQRVTLEEFAWDVVPHEERPGVWELRQGTMTVGTFSSEAAAEAELARRTIRWSAPRHRSFGYASVGTD
jgi:hypothetical protein